MECRNKFCIFWVANSCIEDVVIDECGRCNACIHVGLPDGMLELFRSYRISRLLGDEWLNRHP